MSLGGSGQGSFGEAVRPRLFPASRHASRLWHSSVFCEALQEGAARRAGYRRCPRARGSPALLAGLWSHVLRLVLAGLWLSCLGAGASDRGDAKPGTTLCAHVALGVHARLCMQEGVTRQSAVRVRSWTCLAARL